MRRLVLTAVLGLLVFAVYQLATGVNRKVQSIDEALLFFPSAYPEGVWKPAGLDFRDVEFKSADGTKLHGWHCPCPNARASILHLHGNGGNLTFDYPYFIHLQKKLRVALFSVDYRGYGRSEGRPTVAGATADAEAARAEFARLQGIPEEQVVLLGRSLGGAIAVDLASRLQPRALILESTFASLREIASTHYPAVAWLVPREKLNSLANISRIKAPLLVSHGDADTIVPYSQSEKLFAAAAGPKTWFRISKGDHNDPPTAGYLAKLDEFIGSLAPKSSPPPQSAPANPEGIDDMLLFFPEKYPKGEWRPYGFDHRDAWFHSADGTKLHGWYCPCPDAQAAVLYLHGNGRNLSYQHGFYRHLQRELKVAVFAVDYRGYGRSEGRPTVAGVIADAEAARSEFARLAGVREEQIVLMGRSLGGAIAVDLASRLPPRGIVLESTFSSLRDAAAFHYPAFAWMVPTGKLNSVASIAKYHGPLLQSHGDADTVVPFVQGERLFAAASGPKTWVPLPGGNHNDGRPRQYLDRLREFLAGLPKSDPEPAKQE